MPAWVNQSRVLFDSLTTGRSVSFGFTSTSGNLIILVVAGGVTFTNAAWSTRQSPTASCELWVADKTSTGDSTVTITSNGDAYKCVAYIFEYPAGTAYTTGGSGTDNSSVPPALAGLPGDAEIILTALCRPVSASGLSTSYASSWGGGVTGLTDFFDNGANNGQGVGVAYAEITATSITPTNTPTYGGTWPATDIERATVAYTRGLASLTAISPSLYVIAGQKVTLTGTNYIAGATVDFGGEAATDVTVVNATTITCTVPAHALGDATVTVTTSRGTSAGLTATYRSIAVVSTAAAAITASPQPSVTFPATYTPLENDVIVLFPSSTTTATVNTVSGFVNPLGAGVDVESDAHEISVAYHLVTAGEQSGVTRTYTITASGPVDWYGANETGNVTAVAVRGVSPLVVVDAINSANDVNAVATAVLAGLTGANLSTGSLVLSCVAKDGTGTGYTVPANWTSLVTSSSGQDKMLLMRNALTTTSVNVDATNITQGGSDEYASITLALTSLATGTIVAAAKKATFAGTGEQAAAGMSGTITATKLKATASFSGVMVPAGAVVATKSKATAVFTGVEHPRGALTAALQKATAVLAGTKIYTGAITATKAKATAALAGVMQPKGAVTATAQRATANFSGAKIYTGAITATKSRATASASGVMQPSGALGAALRKATALLSGTYTPPPSTGTLAAAAAKATATLAGLEYPRGALTATQTAATAALTGAQIYAGTITAAAKAATAALTGTEHPQGELTAALQRATITASGTFTGQPGSMTATATRATAALAGVLRETGAITAAATKATAALTGAIQPAGIISAALTRASAVAAGTQTLSGFVTVTLRAATATAAGLQQPEGIVTATLRRASASATGVFSGQPGTLAAAAAKATAALAGVLRETGAITATKSRATAALAGYEHPRGILAAILTRATATLAATHKQQGVLTATKSKATASATGVQQPQGTITAAARKTTAAISGTSVGLPGNAAARLRAATITASGIMPPKGAMAATLRAAVGTAAGAQLMRGTITAALRKQGFTAQGAQLQAGIIIAALQTLDGTLSGVMPPFGAWTSTLYAATWRAVGSSGISAGEIITEFELLRFAGIGVRPAWPSTLRETVVAARARETIVAARLRETTVTARDRTTTIPPRA